MVLVHLARDVGFQRMGPPSLLNFSSMLGTKKTYMDSIQNYGKPSKLSVTFIALSISMAVKRTYPVSKAYHGSKTYVRILYPRRSPYPWQYVSKARDM